MSHLNDSKLGRPAKAFEKRIAEIFQTLGYTVSTKSDSPEVDLVLTRRDPVLHAVVMVELKYYETGLVSETSIYTAERLLRRYEPDKLAIITTLGFTAGAQEAAGRLEEKVVLLTERDLARQIPEPSRKQYYKQVADSVYLRPSLSRYIDRLSQDQLLERLPEESLKNLFWHAIPRREIVGILTEKVRRDRLIQLLTEYVGYEYLENIPIERHEPETSEQKKQKIKEDYVKARNEPDNNLKGAILQNVVREIIQLVPKLKVVGSNVNNAIEEIDLQVRNHNREHVWNDFGGMIFVECKNWSKPVGADEIRNFKVKLEHSNIRSGIFVAVKGLTGKEEMTGAWGEVKQCHQSGYSIVVLDDADLQDILNCRDVSEKIDEKYVKLYQIGAK